MRHSRQLGVIFPLIAHFPTHFEYLNYCSVIGFERVMNLRAASRCFTYTWFLIFLAMPPYTEKENDVRPLGADSTSAEILFVAVLIARAAVSLHKA